VLRAAEHRRRAGGGRRGRPDAGGALAGLRSL